jgi:acyl carrier protein
MTRDELNKIVVGALTSVAPEIDPATIQPSISFRDQLDLDSMDFLNFLLALHDRLGIDIPETDYAKLTTLDDAVAYLASATAARAARQS